jgi:methionyl-tRNA formyltransferase
MRIMIATLKSWNVKKAEQIKEIYKDRHEVMIITTKDELESELVPEFMPDYIFFPHWSYIIPEHIFMNYKCVVFHMTDLPYGRGGSPLQNLIVRGFKETKISAIRVVKELDAGPVYMKEPLSLEGSAEDIFKRAADVEFEVMIPRFFEECPVEKQQEGTPVIFKRRTPQESEIRGDFGKENVYDYIRMLDAEGYPHAYIDYGMYRLEFTGAEWDGEDVSAKVVFRRKGDE